MSKLFRHRHRAVRSFPTKCRECGKPILYWECECGAKAFFTLPIYGKPVRHLCEISVSPGKRRRPWTIAKEVPDQNWQDYGKEKQFQCPSCSKVFKTEERLNSHITQMIKNDISHQKFFDEIMGLVDFEDDENVMEEFRVNTKISKNPGFGSVSIRKKKK